MSNYKKGDLVRLKSGGPAMTISHLWDHAVTAVWFDKYDIRHSSDFLNETIEPTTTYSWGWLNAPPLQTFPSLPNNVPIAPLTPQPFRVPYTDPTWQPNTLPRVICSGNTSSSAVAQADGCSDSGDVHGA